ncbi:MAG: hypothetical protein U0R19_04015 [Bryobacteraceae bacterium]
MANLRKVLNQLNSVLSGRPVIFQWVKHDLQIVFRDPESQIRLRNALLHLQHRREPHISQAIHDLHQVPDSFPGKFEVLSMASLYNAAYASGAKQDVELSAAHAKRAVELWPGNWRSHALLGLALSCLCQWEEAERCFQRARNLDENATLCSEEYGIYRVSLGHVQEILHRWEAVFADTPSGEDRFLRQTLMQLLYLQKNYDGADLAIQTHGSVLRESWMTIAFAAILRMDEGNLSGAARFLKEAYRIALATRADKPNCVAIGLRRAFRLLEGREPDPTDTESNLVSDMILMFAEVRLDRKERVMATLHRMMEAKYPILPWILRFPCVYSLLGNSPEFRDLWHRYFPPGTSLALEG